MFDVNKELKFNVKQWNLFNKQLSDGLEFANIKICEYSDEKIVYLSTLYLKDKGEGQDPMLKMILAELKDMRTEFKEFKQEVTTRLDVIEKDVKVLKEDVAVLKEDVAVLKKDVDLIKQCPTIKKELAELGANN